MKVYLQEADSYLSSDLLLLRHQPLGVPEPRAGLVQLLLDPREPRPKLLTVLPLHVPHPVHSCAPLLHSSDAGLLHLPPHGQVGVLNTDPLWIT